jgi:hypothetical protein
VRTADTWVAFLDSMTRHPARPAHFTRMCLQNGFARSAENRFALTVQNAKACLSLASIPRHNVVLAYGAQQNLKKLFTNVSSARKYAQNILTNRPP